MNDINNAPDGMSLAAASVGWGVYAVMIGGAGIFASAIAVLKEARASKAVAL